MNEDMNLVLCTYAKKTKEKSFYFFFRLHQSISHIHKIIFMRFLIFFEESLKILKIEHN